MGRFIWLFLLILTLPALACRAGSAFIGKTIRGSGEVSEENRPVNGITSAELATTGTLYIELGAREALRVEAEENLLPLLRFLALPQP